MMFVAVQQSPQAKKGFFSPSSTWSVRTAAENSEGSPRAFPEKGKKRRANQKIREILEDLEAQCISFDSSMKFYEIL